MTRTERFLILELKYFRPLRQSSSTPLSDERVVDELQDLNTLKSVLEVSGTRLEDGWAGYLEAIASRYREGLELSTLRYHRNEAIAAFEKRLTEIEDQMNAQQTAQPQGKVQLPALPSSDDLLADIVKWNILKHRAADPGPLQAQIEECLAAVYPPDRALIRGFAEQVDHELLHFVARSLAFRWQNDPSKSLYPILIDLSQYAPLANMEGLIGYASHRLLDNLHSADNTRIAFQADLADLESKGQILWIAGTWDALTTEETVQVLPRLREVSHYLLHTRAWEPHLEFSQRYELPAPVIENPGRFIQERLETTHHLSSDLQLKIGRVAYWDLDRGAYRGAAPERLIFKENDIRYLDPVERQRCLEQARRAGIFLYDGVSFRCDANVADYLAGWYALFDPLCDYFDIVETVLRWPNHPLVAGVAQVLAYTKDWQRLNQVSQAFTAFSAGGNRRQQVEVLGLSVLAAADLVAQVRRLARSKAPDDCVQRVGGLLKQLVATSSAAEVHAAVAQRLGQLGLPSDTVLNKPADHPFAAPPRPEPAMVGQMLSQLGHARLAARVISGGNWTSDTEVLDALVSALRQSSAVPEILVACLHHADLSQQLPPKKRGLAAYMEAPPMVFDCLLDMVSAEPDLSRRSTLLSIIAKPEILTYLAHRKESSEIRSVMQSLALILDAQVFRENGQLEVILRPREKPQALQHA